MWDLNSAKEIQKLTGMENAVTAIALDENTVVTTSTGMKDAMNGVSGYAVRVFKRGEQVSVQRSHYASVRCSAPFFLQDRLPSSISLPAPADGFFTGGNDGKVVCYRSDGSVVFRCDTPPNVPMEELCSVQGEGKYPFMMKVKSMGGADMMHVRSVSVSENAYMYFWEGPNCMQIVKHPASLWDVDVRHVIDPAGNSHVWAITACSDGILRLFSSNPRDWLPEEARVGSDLIG